MNRPNLWAAAHDGMSRAEIEALNIPHWHNWGAWQSVYRGAGFVPLLSLAAPYAPLPDVADPKYFIVGNEPTMPAPDGDGYHNRAWEAGNRARTICDRVHERWPRCIPIVGNVFCSDVSKMPGTAYDGTLHTADQMDYWKRYRDGLAHLADHVSWGFHYTWRLGKPFLSHIPVMSAAAAIKETLGLTGPLYLTELDVESTVFNIDALIGALDGLTWNTSLGAICWAQWPSRWQSAGLWRDGEGLTRLGRWYAGRAKELQAETPQPVEPTRPETVWTIQHRTAWEWDGSAWRVTVERGEK